MMKKKKGRIMTGRPSKFKQEYCQEMVEFFNIPHTIINNEGKEVANILPTFEKFAVEVNVVMSTLQYWYEHYDGFSVAYKKCKQLQKDMLMDLGMRGFYNPTFTIFTAKNITDMKDKQEVATTGTTTQIIVSSKKDATALEELENTE